MKSNHLLWLAGTALAGIAGMSPAMAQQPAEQAAESEIIVTGSRIQRQGFDAPTPTTVLGVEQLQQGDRPSVAQALNDIPQFRPTATPETTTGNTTAAASPADLRGLTAVRTLTLLNGHRFTGSADLNSVPQNLIKRVDVVTGGASAAWGSGAVAGVVNVILDDELTGWKMGANTGISSRGDGYRFGGDIAWGTNFAGDRGHIMVGGEYLKSKGAFDREARPNLNAGLFQRADGQHVLTPDVNYTILNRGGSILSTSAVPYNLVFNPDGSVGPLPLGSETFGQQTVGGGGQSIYDYLSVSTPYERTNLFARVSYDLTDNLKIWAEGSYNRMAGDFSFFPETPISVIQQDNAFLTATARSQLAAAGVTGPFILGRILDDVGPDGMLRFNYARRNLEGAIGLDGSFGDGWSYKVYYDHGELRNRQTLGNQRIAARFNRAIDAVLVNGSPVCRVNADASTTNNDAACVPIDILGNGKISEAGRAYAFGDASSTSTTKLDAAGFSISGQPFATWAGPVDIAVGGDFRWEEFVTNSVDALSAARAFATLNYAPTNGGFNVKEFFAEVAVPLLDVADTAKLEINGAARYSDYSTSGGIWSWKTGGTLRLVNDLLLRAVYSRDIRSPSINEYYLGRATNIGNMQDPFRNNSVALNVFSYTGGNTALDPEVSHTLTLGGSYSPRFVPGLRLSLDFYKIKIDGVIVTLAPQDVLNLCAAQNPSDNLCGGLIERDANGGLVSVLRTYRNLAQYKTKGLDIEAAYQVPVGAGRVTVRSLATHVMELLIDDGVTTTDRAGIVGGDTLFSTPKWRVTTSVGYDDQHFGADLRVRHVSGGQYTYVPGPNRQLPLNNDISGRTYVDLAVRFKVGAFTLYGNVNNLFDRDPPMSQYTNANYDVIGRYFSGGVKLNF